MQNLVKHIFCCKTMEKFSDFLELPKNVSIHYCIERSVCDAIVFVTGIILVWFVITENGLEEDENFGLLLHLLLLSVAGLR